MKAAPFAYERPSDLNIVTALMAEAKDTAKIIAGGQSLGPMLNLRLVQPDLVIDIAGLSELKQADRSGDELVIGACVTHGDIEDGRIPDVTRGAMQRVAAAIAYRAVRNRGTIGGSLSHADPAADWVSALPALGAKVRLRTTSGVRDLAIEDFITGALESALRTGEIVESVRVPVTRASARWGYVKACRKPGEFAHAIAAVLIDPEAAEARVVIGAIETVADCPARRVDTVWRARHRQFQAAIRCAHSRCTPNQGRRCQRRRPAHPCGRAAPGDR